MLPPTIRIALPWMLFCAGISVGAEEGAVPEKLAMLVVASAEELPDITSLRYARQDVFDVREHLLAAGYAEANIVLLHDGEASSKVPGLPSNAEKIREQLKALVERAGPEDSVLVVFSGHGVQFRKDKKNYFCPAGADLSDRGTLIPIAEIYRVMGQCRARQRLLIFDVCRENLLTDAGRGMHAAELERVNQPQTEALPPGMAVFYSCGAGQRSFESDEQKHGVFFFFLLEALRGLADDGDFLLTMEEVVGHAKKATQAHSRTSLSAVQTPYLRGTLPEWVVRSFRDASDPATTDKLEDPSKAKLPKYISSALTGMKLVRIPAGQYHRGSIEIEKEADDDEHPQHRVKISNDFYLGIHEVTQRAWQIIMKSQPWKDDSFVITGNDYPASCVTWVGAAEFCTRLSKREGRTFRLPTEAEWEYACRAKTATQFVCGNDPARLVDHAWFDRNANDVKEAYAHRVCGKKPNPFGLFDMHGNLSEWCADWYGSEEYARATVPLWVDPRGPENGIDRVHRGGGWLQSHALLRSSDRNYDRPTRKSPWIGFRVAADLGAK